MEIFRFVIIGLGAGAIYALVAQGLILVHRGSGVLNFAQGAFVMVGGYAYYQLSVAWGLPLIVGVIGATLVGGILGSLVQIVVLRKMLATSPVLKVIATLAVMMVLQSIAVLIWGVEVLSVPSLLAQSTVAPFGVTVGVDRLILLGIGAILTLGLWSLYRFTPFGRTTVAVAENPVAAASLGHSPEKIATINWALAGAIAALAGALIAPIVYLQPTTLTLLIIPAVAIGLVANFTSFPIAFAAGLALGVIESLTAKYASIPGLANSIPFIVVVLVMVVRGKGLPTRGDVREKWPSVSTGRVPWIPALVFVAILIYLFTFVFSYVWVDAFTISLAFAALCLSVVLVTGYTGQLSLAQYVLAGFGALVAARLMSDLQVPFLLAGLIAVIATMGVGMLVGIPALRTRGINLAIVTLGLGLVLYQMVLHNRDISGGTAGIPVRTIDVFGLDVTALIYPERYAVLALILVFFVAIAVLNVRRGAAGRRLLAVRSNERAAASLGVNVFAIKLFAFAVAAGIAAIAGILLAFRSTNIIASQFGVFESITTVAMTVVGGVGFVGGGVMGSTLLPGGVATAVFSRVDGLPTWLPLISGIVLLWILVRRPSGLWAMNVHLVHSIRDRIRARARRRRHASGLAEADLAAAPVTAPVTVEKVPALTLQVENMRVTFGGVVAVDDVSFQVRSGEILGLIGPNGAGKTTVIDAATGFVRASGGRVRLGDKDLTKRSPRWRAQAGLQRSFQSVELFEDLTIRENLAVASDRWTFRRYLVDFIAPGRIQLAGPALAAAREFGLLDDLDATPQELSLGKRRLAAIARSVAAAPSILCLDEPAAGLSSVEASELVHLLRKLSTDWSMGVLLVEHNVDLVLATCDRITVLAQGKVLTTGTPDEVRNDERVLEAYFGNSVEAPKEDAPTVGASPVRGGSR